MQHKLSNIETYLPALRQLCLRYGVEKLYVFGSVLTERFDAGKKSDIDVLIEMPETMPPLDRGENILGLWNDLEELFGRSVDLMTTTQLKNPYLIDSINKEKVLIYDFEDEKVFS